MVVIVGGDCDLWCMVVVILCVWGGGSDCGWWCIVVVIVGVIVGVNCSWWCMVVVIAGGDVVNEVGGA